MGHSTTVWGDAVSFGFRGDSLNAGDAGVGKGGCYRDWAMYSSVLNTHDFTSMVGEPLYVALEYIM